MITLSKKVCLLGDFAVGKTSLVRRFVYNLFEDKYLSTIGVKVSRKVLVVPKGDAMVELTMILWDLAGSEEFDSVRISYLRGAAGALAVCDMTRVATLDHIHTYVRELWSVSPKAPVILVANKVDLVGQHQFGETQIQATAADLRIPYHITSAKTGEHVEEAFRQLGRLLITESVS